MAGGCSNVICKLLPELGSHVGCTFYSIRKELVFGFDSEICDMFLRL